jgi:Ca2+-binding EF-hand superfamily protein
MGGRNAGEEESQRGEWPASPRARRLVTIVGLLAVGLGGCSKKEEAATGAVAPPAQELAQRVPGAGYPMAPAPESRAGTGAPGIPGSGADLGAPAIPELPGPLGDREWVLERQKEEIAASDTDGDGALNQEEYLKRYIERHRRRFEMLDADKDGKLTAEEMADMMDPQTMMKRAGQPIGARAPAAEDNRNGEGDGER